MLVQFWALKIFDVLRSQFKNLEIQNYVVADVGYDYFSGIDDVISGVPDGYIPSKKTILEIKTAGEKNMIYEKKMV
ncbi:hypothetical protein NW062_07565 [Mycoplasmopsis cynos]|nr:hypothetical protein NW062_07565 [Mycoplasmopsis cynos]